MDRYGDSRHRKQYHLVLDLRMEYLSRYLDVTDELLAYIYGYEELGCYTYDKLKETKINRVHELIAAIKTRPEKGFTTFIRAILHSGQLNVITELRQLAAEKGYHETEGLIRNEEHIYRQFTNPDQWTEREIMLFREHGIPDETRQILIRRNIFSLNYLKCAITKSPSCDSVESVFGEVPPKDIKEVIKLLPNYLVDDDFKFRPKETLWHDIHAVGPLIEKIVKTDDLLLKLEDQKLVTSVELGKVRYQKEANSFHQLVDILQSKKCDPATFLHCLCSINQMYLANLMLDPNVPDETNIHFAIEAEFTLQTKKETDLKHMIAHYTLVLDTMRRCQGQEGRKPVQFCPGCSVIGVYFRPFLLLIQCHSREAWQKLERLSDKTRRKHVLKHLNVQKVDIYKHGIELNITQKEILDCNSIEDITGLNSKGGSCMKSNVKTSTKDGEFMVLNIIGQNQRVEAYTKKEGVIGIKLIAAMVENEKYGSIAYWAEPNPENQCWVTTPIVGRIGKKRLSPRRSFTHTIYMKLKDIRSGKMNYIYNSAKEGKTVKVYKDQIRRLILDDPSKDVYVKYDGPVQLKRSPSLFGPLFFGEAKDQERAIEACFPTCPDYTDHDSVELLLALVNAIYTGVPEENQNVFVKYLKALIHGEMEVLRPKNPSPTNLLRALIVLYFIQRYKLSVSTSDEECILENLHIYPDYIDSVNGLKTLEKFNHLSTILDNVFAYYTVNAVTRFPLSLYCIPVIHIIRGNIQPFSDPDWVFDRTRILTDDWWGIADMKQHCDRSNIYKLKIQNLREILSECSIDGLMSRTVADMFLEDDFLKYTLHELLPADVTFAYVWRALYLRDEAEHSEQLVTRCIAPLFRNSGCRQLNDTLAWTPLRNSASRKLFCLAALQEIMKLLEGRRNVTNEECLFVTQRRVLTLWTYLINHFKEEERNDHSYEFKQDMREYEDEALKTTFDWINKYFKSSFDIASITSSHSTKLHAAIEKRLKFADDLLKLRWTAVKEESFQNQLVQHMGSLFRSEEINTTTLLHAFLGFDPKKKKLSDKIYDKFRDVIFKRIDAIIHTGDSALFQLIEDDSPLCRLLLLFARVLKGAMPTGTKHKLLQHLLTWPAFENFITFIHSPYVRNHPDRNCCEELLNPSIIVLRHTMHELYLGNIDLESLDILKQNKDALMGLYNNTASNLPSPFPSNKFASELEIPCIIRMLGYREKQFIMYQQIRANIRQFASFTSSTKDHIKWIDDMIERTQKVVEYPHDVPLRGIPYRDGQIPSESELYRNIFQVEESIVRVIKSMIKWQRSQKFLVMWNRTKERLMEDPPQTQEQFYHNFWIQLKNDFDEYLCSLAKGTIKIQEFQALDELYKKNNECLVFDIKLQEDISDDVVINRLTEIETARQSVQYMKIFDVLDRFQTVYDLRGDFTPIKGLSEKGIEDRKMELKEIEPAHEDFLRRLNNVTKDKCECIWAFIQCKELIDWINDKCHNEEEEGSLIEQIFTAASSQDSVAVDKAESLRLSIQGYRPLLHGALSGQCSYDRCLDLLEQVWEKFSDEEEYHRLPDDLRQTHDDLNWIKLVEEAQGFVEVSAMESVRIINNGGVFCVIMPGETSELSLEDIIRVFVDVSVCAQDSAQQRRMEKYLSVSDLQDLQTRLTLISRTTDQKDEAEIDRFIQIFEGVTALGEALLGLIQNGHLLFSQLELYFNCNKHERTKATAKLGFEQEGVKPIQATSKFDVTYQISDLIGFFIDQQTTWTEYLKRQRGKYHELNFFTIDQLIILQKQLENYDDNHGIYPILKNILPVCTPETLRIAIEEGSRKLKTARLLGAEAKVNETTITAADVEKREFIEELQRKAKVDIDLAAEAAHTVSGYNEKGMKEAILYCIRESRSQRRDKGHGKADHCINEAHLGYLKRVDRKSNDIRPQLEKVKQEWENDVSKSYTDFLSVENVGMVLESIHGVKNQISREMPTCLKSGKPNLLLCEKGDILPMLFTIYMETDYMIKSLPGPDEILMCSENTTTEEIDLFWRRAVGDSCGKIYTLCCAEKLRYRASLPLEENIENMEKADMADAYTNKKFQLVVICDTKKENETYLASALKKYHRTAPDLKPDEEIRDYLARKLKVPSDSGISAAEVDPQRSSVRLVCSDVAGSGKSHYIEKSTATLKSLHPGSRRCVFSLQNHKADINKAVEKMIELEKGGNVPILVHIDIGETISEDVDQFLFNLLILGSIKHTSGKIWKRSQNELYLIEAITKELLSKKDDVGLLWSLFKFLPLAYCESPITSLEGTERLLSLSHIVSQAADIAELTNEMYQRPYHYLRDLPEMFDVSSSNVNPRDVLQCLIAECGLKDPTWAEIRNFTSFLNVQLTDAEKFISRKRELDVDMSQILAVLAKFFIQMSKDFATRSMAETEELLNEDSQDSSLLTPRKWETSPHPYVFFNYRQDSVVCIGMQIDEENQIVTENHDIKVNDMLKLLDKCLRRIGINIRDGLRPLNSLRKYYLDKLRKVFGVTGSSDPDQTYELTEDNVKKMLAVFMRFRCGIPVIVMGETGCGKTRLVKFLCDVMRPSADMNNMVMLKVHSGVTDEDIYKAIAGANALDKANNRDGGGQVPVPSILFFDEANTTEHIGLIKEVMCDSSKDIRLELGANVAVVAACNPYRKHSDEMIDRLTDAGLGFHEEEAMERLGKIPMRHLVYRVQPLPPSLKALVWDFGTLSDHDEKLYIQQMVLSFEQSVDVRKETGLRDLIAETSEIISDILSQCQIFMRKQKHECSFVSLRDVDRSLRSLLWFYKKQDHVLPFTMKFRNEDSQTADLMTPVERLKRALILSLGVCYHACLESKTRQKLREEITPYFTAQLNIDGGPDAFAKEIDIWQTTFLDDVTLKSDIAKNNALKDNVFMLVVGIELRIPIFLIGKPGSSKSLSKTVVMSNMQGRASRCKLFRHFKRTNQAKYQCSQASTPDSIFSVFEKCQTLQEGKDLDNYVAVVVLDEIGLAEDSEQMPLKALHSLLDDGFCIKIDKVEEHKRFAFIGISNWALDPAKMNRGIMVHRGVPNKAELILTAEGICGGSNGVSYLTRDIPLLADAYLEVCRTVKLHEEIKREFYGLRDFYCTIKMLNQFVQNSNGPATAGELKHAVMRNFGGADSRSFHPWDIFKQKLSLGDTADESSDPQNSPLDLIESCLRGKRGNNSSEMRHLLILTENYAGLAILQQMLDHDCVVIFGSKFPLDQMYTKVVRNINKIKDCMELGKTVVLLNLDSHYESLYEMLNGYFTFRRGGIPVVDLGLGARQIQCKVHPDFRLVLVAEKNHVYQKFEVPLINRVEKHILIMEKVLDNSQMDVVFNLRDWVYDITNKTSHENSKTKSMKPADLFVGYSSDTISATVYHASGSKTIDSELTLLDHCKEILLESCTPDSIVRLRGVMSEAETGHIYSVYFNKQCHENLTDFLQQELRTRNRVLAQVTTYSELLSRTTFVHTKEMLTGIIDPEHNFLISVQEFETEHQFRMRLKKHCTIKEKQLLLFQFLHTGGTSVQDLIACARHCVMDELMADEKGALLNIIFIVHLPRKGGGCFESSTDSRWMFCHIDELTNQRCTIPSIDHLRNISVADLFKRSLDNATEPERRLDVGHLISKCMHSAINLLKDDDDKSERQLVRIRKLSNLKVFRTGQNAQETAFRRVIQVRVTRLLSSKEEDDCIGARDEWLEKYVARASIINTAGTFRRSLWQYLLQEVKPLLAALFAYMDTNNNMDTFYCSVDPSKQWLDDVWTDMLSNMDLVDIQYKDIKGQTNFPVAVIGSVKEPGFTPQCPFSWIIKKDIDECMARHPSIAGLYLDFLIFRKKYGGVLDKYFADPDRKTDLIRRYLNDFVRLTYNATSLNEPELMLVIDGIWRDITASSEEERTITQIHVIYKNLRSRLGLFIQIAAQYPTLLQKLDDFNKHKHKLKEARPYLDDTGLMCLDLKASWLLIETLEEEALFDQGEQRFAWAEQVQDANVYIEQMISIMDSDWTIPAQWGDCMKEFKKKWSRIRTMRLFVHHLCLSDEVPCVEPSTCYQLWAFMDDVDFWHLESLDEIESVITACNDVKRKDITERLKLCPGCKNEYKTDLYIWSPCRSQCKCCEKCVTMSMTNRTTQKCIACSALYPADYRMISKTLPSPDDDPEIIHYRKRMYSFFMEFVGSMCLLHTHMSKGMCYWLLDYVTARKSLTDQDTQESTNMGNEPTLLALFQLLITNSGSIVKEYMVDYLNSPGDEKRKMHTILRYIYCHEMVLHHSDPMHYVNEPEISTKLQSAIEDMTTKYEYNEHSAESGAMVIFEAISEYRFAVTKAVAALYELLNAGDISLKNTQATGLVETLRCLKEEPLLWPRLYLIRSVVRTYGWNYFIHLQTTLGWNDSCVLDTNMDICRCLSRSYGNFRDVVEDNDKIDNAKELMDDSYAPICLILAVHSLIQESDEKRDAIKKNMRTIVTRLELSEVSKDIIDGILRSFDDSIRPWEQQEITILATHLSAVARHRRDDTIMCLFRIIIEDPDEANELYIPTMPDSDREHSGESLTDLDISKGHTIGDPDFASLCHHQGVREMSQISLLVTRTFLHISMMLGAEKQPQDVAQWIRPNVTGNLALYLKDHILTDIRALASVCGRNMEDIFILLHVIVRHMFSVKQDSGTENSRLNLNTLNNRSQWEKTFQAVYVGPIISNPDAVLRQAYQDINYDNSSFIDDVYELTDDAEPPTLDDIMSSSRVWSHRNPVLIERVCRALQQQEELKRGPTENTKIYRKLLIFLRHEHLLRFVRYLPAVLKLQKYLINIHDKNINRDEAARKSISDVIARIRSKREREDITDLFEKYCSLIRELQPHSNMLKAIATLDVSAFTQLHTVDLRTPLELLLPRKQGQGLQPLLVVKFLVHIQNSFLLKCSETCNENPADIVDLQHITAAQLVSVHHDNEFMPLMSTCTQSFDMRSGTTPVRYDFETLAYAIHHRFLKRKFRIEDSKICLMTYTDEITDEDLFKELRLKIPQEELPRDVQRQLEQEQTHLPTIHEHLENLGVAIGLLVSVGKEEYASTELIQYLRDTLKMEQDTLPDKVNRCQLKHVENLWVLLAHEKSKHHLRNNLQDPLDDADIRLTTDLSHIQDPVTVQKNFERLLKNMGEKQLGGFLLHLFRAITLKFPSEDTMNIQTISLKAALRDFYRELKLDEPTALTEKHFDAKLLVCHAVHVWKIAANFQIEHF